jgi:hypothetical protein
MSGDFPSQKNMTFRTMHTLFWEVKGPAADATDAYEYFDFSTVAENICRSRTAINRSLTVKE